MRKKIILLHSNDSISQKIKKLLISLECKNYTYCQFFLLVLPWCRYSRKVHVNIHSACKSCRYKGRLNCTCLCRHGMSKDESLLYSFSWSLFEFYLLAKIYFLPSLCNYTKKKSNIKIFCKYKCVCSSKADAKPVLNISNPSLQLVEAPNHIACPSLSCKEVILKIHFCLPKMLLKKIIDTFF